MSVTTNTFPSIRVPLNKSNKILKRSGQWVLFDHKHVDTLFSQLIEQEQLDPNLVDQLSTTVLNTWQTLEDNLRTTQKLKTIIMDALQQFPVLRQAIQTYDEKFATLYTEQQDLNLLVARLQQKDQTIANENANKDSDIFNTQRDLTAGLVAKTTGLKLLPKQIAKAHLKGDLHYHDLDYHPYAPMTNCCLIDFKEMLDHGFKIGNAEVESPHSIQTATAQISQIIANVASSQYGGCSVDRIDELLAPFAQKNYEKHLQVASVWLDTTQQQDYATMRTQKDIYDAMQSLEYEINTLFTSNGQTPFTSVGFGLGTNWFEREIQKAILTIRIEGLGIKKRTAIFPKLIFTIKKGTNFAPTDPNYDIKQLALTCSARRMYPDILNYDKIVELTGSFKVPMGCRSFLQSFKDHHEQEVTSGRMNLGVVTLNLPRLALRARQDQAYFWRLLDEKLTLAKEALFYRIERCKEAVPKNAPILYQSGAFGIRLTDEEAVDTVFRNKRATISLGYIGLYEVATAFYGPNWEDNLEAKDFTLEIVKKMDQQTKQWSDQYGYHFSVYATPSESLTDRFCRLDQQRFGQIPAITDKDYYTNSFHYDVRKQPTPFEKIDFEQVYPKYSSGGFIHYCEYPVLTHNIKALEAVWDYSYTRVGYLGTNTPIDRCFLCGFEGEFSPTARGFECPTCHNRDPKQCEVVKRTCGYLGNPQARPMVHGRHQEITARKKHL
ncbi:anaerobic ribonucleoside-triphosphate reductase [Enterococcus bulliens]